jgi:hypothetical protein
MQLILIVLTKIKETIRYYRLNIFIMGFSLITPYNGLFKSSISGIFTNKFLHLRINNKIISINRKEASTISNSSTKVSNNKIRSSTTK